jgi:signal transduction histidine kinase
VLSEHGLVEALRSAVDRYPLPLTLDLKDPGRHPAQVEAALYFSCVEAMQNAAKHAGTARVRVSLGADEHEVWFTVEDDGDGFAPRDLDAGGIVNMQDRLGASGGTLTLESALGVGTTVRGRVPVARAGRRDRPEVAPVAR